MMASSRFESEQFMSEAFVESVGAIPFRLMSREICILHLLGSNEYVLAKGRRNCGESRQAAALREVAEETGFICHLLPLKMYTRAPPAVETEQLNDKARFYTGICEPFALQVRRLDEGDIKLIWWFIAAVDAETYSKEKLEGRRGYEVEFYNYTDVLERLTFQQDRDMVKRAIDLVTDSYSG
jgi:8-oxo-dGTP pyrophosphatase MutT (NUDIX family)